MGGQTVLKQYIDGAAAVDQYSVELNLVDTRIEDQGKTSWFRYGGPLVLPAEVDFVVRPRGEPRIGEKVVGVCHVQASAGEQLAFPFGLDGHFAADDGMHAISWLDVFMTRVCIVVVVILIALFPCVVRLVRRIRSLLTRVDSLEDAAILHGMV